MNNIFKFTVLLFITTLVSGCEGFRVIPMPKVTSSYGKGKTNTLKEKKDIETNYHINDRFDNDDYPKTRQERKEEEIGSILGSEGLTFKPTKIKNETTKTTSTLKVNDYLWKASMEYVMTEQIDSAEKEKGIISTLWNPKTHSKMEINITDNVISPDAINVKIWKRFNKGSEEGATQEDAILATKIEENILRRARELYMRSQK